MFKQSWTPEKLAQVTNEVRRYKLQILGVSEARWTSSGSTRTSTGEPVRHSGWEDGQHREGVAIILQKGVEKTNGKETNGKLRSSLRDIKVLKGADVASGHHLLTADIDLKLKRSRPLTKRDKI